MKNLAQTIYEDSNGLPFPAKDIDCITPYTPPNDGFFAANCAKCGAPMGGRHFRFFGVVHQCPECGANNLLVRTDVQWVNNRLEQGHLSKEDREELERLRDIEKFNSVQMNAVKQRLIYEVEQALHKVKTHDFKFFGEKDQ